MLPPEILNFFRVWKKQIYLFVALAAAFQIAVMQLNSFFLSVVMVPIYFILVKGLTRRYVSGTVSDGRMLLEIFLLSLFIRIAEVFVLGYVFQTYNALGLPFMSDHDDYNYHNSMLDIYGYWQEFGITTVQNTKIRFGSGMYSGYPYFGAFMMEIFGPNAYAARIGNAIVSSFTVLTVFSILASCADRAKTILGTLIFALSPIVMIFAACNFKDTMLLACILLSVWSVINFTLKRRWLISVVALLAAISFMIFCRPASIFILLLASNVFVFFRFASFKHSTVLLVTNVLVLFATLAIWRYCDQLELTTDYETFWEMNVNASQRTIAENTTAGVSRFSAAKLLSAPLFAACSPFLPPATLATFEGKDVGVNYTFHGMLAYFTLLPFMIYGVLQAIRFRKFQPIPFLLVLVCFLYKFAQANSLLTILSPRQSLPAMALLTLMVPAGLDRFHNNKLFVFAVNTIAIVIILAFNIYRVFF